VNKHGGSASIDEILQTVIELEGLTEAQQGVLHGDGPATEIGYRLAWARTYLKGMGLLTNSRRGVWTLTDEGHRFVAGVDDSDVAARDQVRERWSKYLVELRAVQRAKRISDSAANGPLADAPAHLNVTAPAQ
jgi:restriction system protein